MIPISRTIGGDRLVDEFVACFEHDFENDTLLPGIKPIGNSSGSPWSRSCSSAANKLCTERFCWDQASGLVQLGLLNSEELPSPRWPIGSSTRNCR